MLLRLDSQLRRVKVVQIVGGRLRHLLLLWLLRLFLGAVEVTRELNTDFGGRHLALLPGEGLLLEELSLDLLLDLGQLCLLELDALQPLEDDPGPLLCLHQLGAHRDAGHLGWGRGHR